MSRPLPAYAKPVAQARRRGLTLRDRSVSVRLHWGPRPIVGYGVVVPDDKNPEDLDWNWIRGLDVLVYKERDAAERVAQAIVAIAACRPRRLLIVNFIDETVMSLVTPPEHDHAGA